MLTTNAQFRQLVYVTVSTGARHGRACGKGGSRMLIERTNVEERRNGGSINNASSPRSLTSTSTLKLCCLWSKVMIWSILLLSSTLIRKFPLFFPFKKKRGNDPARLQMTELVFKPAQQGATPDSCAHSHKSWCVCSLGARRCTNLFPEANVNMPWSPPAFLIFYLPRWAASRWQGWSTPVHDNPSNKPKNENWNIRNKKKK